MLSYGDKQEIHRFKKNRNLESIREFRRICAGYFERMKAKMSQATSIDSPEDFEAFVATGIAVSYDQRSIEKLMGVIGRMKGHDQQRVSIHDEASIQKILADIRQSIPRQLVDGEVKVKAPIEAPPFDATMDDEEET